MFYLLCRTIWQFLPKKFFLSYNVLLFFYINLSFIISLLSFCYNRLHFAATYVCPFFFCKINKVAEHGYCA